MKTKVINLFAGPGAGKSTTATGVFSLLKMHDVNCEYVSEYAKDLSWEGTLNDVAPEKILQEQWDRMSRLIGKVEYIISDSPLLMQCAYAPSLYSDAWSMMQEFDNINYFVIRSKVFNPKGRNHDFKQSTGLDVKIHELLQDNKQQYESVYGNYHGVNHITWQSLKTIGKQIYINIEGHLN